jgi:hypothetical protein
MLWLGTLEVKRDLLRPLVECALIEDCMAPPGANIECLHKARTYLFRLSVEIRELDMRDFNGSIHLICLFRSTSHTRCMAVAVVIATISRRST